LCLLLKFVSAVHTAVGRETSIFKTTFSGVKEVSLTNVLTSKGSA
jgi:hypothetical protein